MHLLGVRDGRVLRLVHRKSGQHAVESMMNKTDVSWVYQTADGADDKIEGHTEWYVLYPSFSSPPSTVSL